MDILNKNSKYVLEGNSKFQKDVDKLFLEENLSNQHLNSQKNVDEIMKCDTNIKKLVEDEQNVNKSTIKIGIIGQERPNSISLSNFNDSDITAKFDEPINYIGLSTSNLLANEINKIKIDILEKIYELAFKGTMETNDPFFYTDGHIGNILTYRIDCDFNYDVELVEQQLMAYLNEEGKFVPDGEYNVNITKNEYRKKGINVYSKDEHYKIEILFRKKIKYKENVK